MMTKLVGFAFAAALGGLLVALPGVSEAVRSAIGISSTRQEAQPLPAAPEPDRAKNAAATDAKPDGDDAQTDEVRLSPDQIKLIGLKTVVAKRVPIAIDLRLNGEVTANQDRIVQVLPRTPGIVRDVLKHLGDRVRAGEPLVVLESRQLAEAEAEYLAVRSKAALAQVQLQREEGLYKKKITSERDYLTVKQAAEAAQIELRGAEQKLLLLGFDPKAAEAKASGAPARVPVFAPFDGTLIEKRVAVGDQVNDQSPLFRIANLENVWVIANVFEKDLSHVSVGQDAVVTLRAYPERKFEGKITWMSEVLDEKTRTLKVRVELDNRERLLKPGSFAHVFLTALLKEDGVAVPPVALRRRNSELTVFVVASEGVYKRRQVKIGARSRDTVEIVEGVAPGEKVVTSGSFILASELEKASFAGD